tara:strand:- start:17851 stop:18246 length:396 start_codon:yes stop_codon:yes gene_type:complete
MLQKKIKVTKLKVHKDDRGMLAKIFDYTGLKGKNIQDIYVTTTPPDQKRADHYHKKTTEWFCAIKGKGIMKFKSIESDEEFELEIDADDMSLVEVPPEINHQVLSAGDEELILIAFGNQPYKDDDTDTYSL